MLIPSIVFHAIFVKFFPINLLMAQIHEYVLSKAPPVPQLSPSQGSDEHTTSGEGEARATSQDVGAVATAEELQNPAVVEIEEVHEAPVNVNPTPTGVRVSTDSPARGLSDQLLQKPEPRVQKPADDRLFTLAAIGLTIAIVVLLLKKFMKSSGHGAVFMDGS